MTSVPPQRRPTGDEASFPQTLADWFQLNTKYVAIGLGVIATGVLGYWMYTQNAERNARAAEQQLLNARRAYDTGNMQLAQTDLKRVVDGHPNTRAGVEAALLLAESYFADRKFQEGIDVLEKFTTRGSAEVARAKIYSLIGDGRLELGNPGEAASTYRRAAESARFDGERAQQLAKRARALEAGGDTAASRKVWEDLVESTQPGIAAEARVRLGELTVAPAPRS